MAADKKEFIDELVRGGYLKTPRLIEAFNGIDRKDFILPETMGEAYGNYPLPIGFGQTISQPLTVAFMLELLAPEPGEKILDVGAGSGWTTSLLAYIIASNAQTNADSTRTNAEKMGQRESASSRRKSAGYVVAIERIPELCKFGEENVRKYNFVAKGVAKFFCGDGSRGAPPEFLPAGGFDKILAGAAAAIGIPDTWKRQLKVGGRIVAPVGQSVVVLDKISEKGPALSSSNGFKEKEYFGFSFVPLIRG